MRGFFGILAAGPAFFVSAWILMIFAGIVTRDVGIRPFGYVTSMVVTIPVADAGTLDQCHFPHGPEELTAACRSLPITAAATHHAACGTYACRHLHRKWTKSLPKFLGSFSTRW